jgi:hypothetical protein
MRIPAIATLLASLLAGGCAASSPPDLLPSFNPADPALGLRSARYAPVLGDFEPRRPTGPENWRDLNDRLSPANREPGS